MTELIELVDCGASVGILFRDTPTPTSIRSLGKGPINLPELIRTIFTLESSRVTAQKCAKSELYNVVSQIFLKSMTLARQALCVANSEATEVSVPRYNTAAMGIRRFSQTSLGEK
jgi:hypothetical protein